MLAGVSSDWEYIRVGAKAQLPTGAIVNGTVEFRDVGEPSSDVTVRIRVQDVSHADASATTVAEQVVKGVTIAPGAPPLRFTVAGVPINPSARYIVRVHADVNGDGVVSRGDYVTTQSYPLQTSEEKTPLSIVARLVR